jgi:tyrosine-protein kinase
VQSSTYPASMPASGTSAVLAVARRWRWIILAAAIAAFAAEYAVASNGAPRYESRAVLLTGTLSSDDNILTAAGQLAETYAQLATTRPVLNAVSRRVGVGDLKNAVDASASPVTRLLTIRAHSTEPRLAAAIANADADQLVALAARRQGAGALSSSGRLHVVDPAVPEATATGRRPGLMAALAGLVGALSALGFALLLDRSATTVRTTQELEALTGVPCVGSLSRAALKRSGGDTPLVASAPRSRAAYEYRLLATKLSMTGRHSVLVTAVDGDSGVMARNLAAALSAAGARVALIDVDAADAEPALPVGSTERSGAGTGPRAWLGRLAERTLSNTPVMRALNRTSVTRAPNGTSARPTRTGTSAKPTLNGTSGKAVNGHRARSANGVAVLPAGAVRQARLGGSDGVRVLIEQVEAEADVVVLHAPSLQNTPEGLIWARAAEATLLLVQRDRTDASRLRAAAETLSLVRAELCGTVLAESPTLLRV